MNERRRFPRQLLLCPVQIKAVDAADQYLMRNSFCMNISALGIEITSFDFYPVSGKVHLKLLSNACVKLFEIIGRIIWVQEMPFQNKYKIGIEFVDKSRDVDNTIKTIMHHKTTEIEMERDNYEELL